MYAVHVFAISTSRELLLLWNKDDFNDECSEVRNTSWWPCFIKWLICFNPYASGSHRSIFPQPTSAISDEWLIKRCGLMIEPEMDKKLCYSTIKTSISRDPITHPNHDRKPKNVLWSRWRHRSRVSPKKKWLDKVKADCNVGYTAAWHGRHIRTDTPWEPCDIWCAGLHSIIFIAKAVSHKWSPT